MSTSTSKAHWTPANHKIFIDLCLEEILKGNKPGSHFTKEGWRNLIGSFYAKTGIRHDRKQIKNHWDATRKQWRLWVKLIGDSSMKWDPKTNNFGATEEDWHNYIKENPEAAQFQFKEIQFPDKLSIIFDEGTQTGEMTASTRLKRENDDLATYPLHGKVREKKLKNLAEDNELKSSIPIHAMPINTIASEQSMSSSSHHKVKATWTPPLHKIFIDLCLQETLKGNKPSTHFTREGWKNIVESFHSKSGLNLERLQLKNHWDATKEQWKIWSKLVGTSHMKWNQSKQRFDADEEDWANYIEANPDAAQFRFKELQFADKLETIFNGATITGETEAPVQHSINSLHAKEHDTAKPDEKTDCLCDAVESRNGVIIQKNATEIPAIEGKLSYSIGECIECLDRMEEIEQGSELYLFALDVFLKQEYREIFLQLKKPNLRISWLQRLQSVGTPLL
ncbi:L10-interacting MYB domain-containing protein isoform X1 [Senna tora]|uniref:L10-interacting MYB domain-containing protein isoform X1 n=1 Tax=Senna tora TaxID=362788 RepID=A0A834WSR1_9FABA|nr:L10-interacting MYB domain-containing protein isoform X1 [Senna tora]